MRKKIAALATAVALGLTSSVAVQAPALAVGCWGDWCSGQDPHTTGCDADGVTVATARIPGTYVNIELRWSATCQTNWARVPQSWGTTMPNQLVATQCKTGYQQAGVVQSDATWSWTRQIYSPKLAVAAAWVGSPGSVGTACV